MKFFLTFSKICIASYGEKKIVKRENGDGRNISSTVACDMYEYINRWVGCATYEEKRKKETIQVIYVMLLYY